MTLIIEMPAGYSLLPTPYYMRQSRIRDSPSRSEVGGLQTACAFVLYPFTQIVNYDSCKKSIGSTQVLITFPTISVSYHGLLAAGD